MIKPKLFIINFNLLYEILDEIKENLSFEIIKHEDEKNFIKDERFNKKNSLVIFNSKKKLNLGEQNILDSQEYPIFVTKLIELINIQLIKIRFNYQSKININDYQLNLNSKIFSKANLNLELTEKEIEIILYLDTNKNKHSVLDLQKNIWGYAVDMETHTVETHIYRLRKKILEKFNSENFILSDADGYFIKEKI